MDQERQRLILALLRDLNLRVTALEVEVGADFGKLARKMLDEIERLIQNTPNRCPRCSRIIAEGHEHIDPWSFDRKNAEQEYLNNIPYRRAPENATCVEIDPANDRDVRYVK